MSTERYFKTKLVRDTVSVEYDSEDNTVWVSVDNVIGQHMTLSYNELDYWIELLKDLKDEVSNAKATK